MSQPLSGIRILDLSRLLPGAYASQMMADFGADVIKVEEPGSGDYGRSTPPYGPNGMGLVFSAVNRNKRSISLNLKSESGCAIFRSLVKQVDVVLESFRPGVLDRLGLGYASLKEINPGLIYCAITGYGQDGPYKNRAGHDLNYVGYAGLLYYNRGSHGELAMPATQLADLAGGGYQAVIGILAALVGRAQTGEGRMIDVSMTEGALSLLPIATATYLNNEQAPIPGRSHLDGGLPCYNIYEARDGKYVTLAALEPKFWHTFCTRIGHLELLPFHMPVGPGEREEAINALKAVFKTKTRDEWMAELADLDACLGPVYSIEEVFNDPHMQARGAVVSDSADGYTLRMVSSFPRISGCEQEQRYVPPELGEHTSEVLQDFGYSEDDIKRLKAEGAI